MPMRSPSWILGATLAVASLHCGGAEPAPKAPVDTPKAADEPTDKPKVDEGAPSVGAEYGGMNEAKVAGAFAETYDALEHCLEEGAQGMPYLAGTINFYLEVDHTGSVVHAHVDKSDLGDRSIAKCMIGVLRGKTWPKPVGGKLGKIQSGMTFSPAPDSSQPVAWEPHRVATAVGDLAEPIENCKAGAAGKFTATAYIGTYMQKPDPEGKDADDEPKEVGKIIAVGVTPPDKEGEAAVDCIVDVLRSGTYPSPGERPAKVTFPL